MFVCKLRGGHSLMTRLGAFHLVRFQPCCSPAALLLAQATPTLAALPSRVAPISRQVTAMLCAPARRYGTIV